MLSPSSYSIAHIILIEAQAGIIPLLRIACKIDIRQLHLGPREFLQKLLYICRVGEGKPCRRDAHTDLHRPLIRRNRSKHIFVGMVIAKS